MNHERKGGGVVGWCKVLGNLPVPGRPTYLDYSRTRAYCACNRCGWGLFGHFSLICHFSFLSPSLWETARYRLKYCPKGPLNPEQPTNQRKESFPELLTIASSIWVETHCGCLKSAGNVFSHKI